MISFVICRYSSDKLVNGYSGKKKYNILVGFVNFTIGGHSLHSYHMNMEISRVTVDVNVMSFCFVDQVF